MAPTVPRRLAGVAIGDARDVGDPRMGGFVAPDTAGGPFARDLTRLIGLRFEWSS
jgi:hypothetical protein